MARRKRHSLPRRSLSKARQRRLPCGCVRVLASQTVARAARQVEAARRELYQRRAETETSLMARSIFGAAGSGNL
jgi:hypothetical protein